MVRAIHLKTDNGYRCGVGKRWHSQDISSTRDRASVTCKRCKRLAIK
jgi:hypothetical protein